MSWIVTLLLALFFIVYAHGAAQFKKQKLLQESQNTRELRTYFILQKEYLRRIHQRAKGHTWNTFSNKQHRARMSIQDSIENITGLNGSIKDILEL